MTLAVIERMSLTDLLLVIAIVGAAVKVILESFGWTRSSKLLRDENQDLVDRNRTLEADKVERTANEVRLQTRIAALESRVKELESRDQAAVLAELKLHEQGAETRSVKTLASLDRILDRLQTPSSLDGATAM